MNKSRKGKKEMKKLLITMPPNATEAEIKGHKRMFEDIVKTFAKITGEKPIFKWEKQK